MYSEIRCLRRLLVLMFNPTISLCMIVRDEAHILGACLDSVAELVEQYCIVDTGSTDGTIELLTKRGLTPRKLAWESDFAAARNVSLKMARCDWILILDADEALARCDHDSIRALLRHSNTCWEFMQRHYSCDPRLSNFTPCKQEYPELEMNYPGYFESGLTRLFPNHKRITYRGRVHELAEHSIREISTLTTKQSLVRIHHYGHTPEAYRIKAEKGQLYTALGTTKATESPQDWKAFFELGVQHNIDGRLTESAVALQQSAALNPEYAETWVNLGYVLCELKNSQAAIEALHQAIKLAPHNPEAWCNAGLVKLRINELHAAEQLFRRAAALRPHYVTALCNLGLVYAKQGRLAESVLWYKKALDIMPNCFSALLDIATLYTHGHEDAAAERFMKTAAACINSDARREATYTKALETIQAVRRSRAPTVIAPHTNASNSLARSTHELLRA